MLRLLTAALLAVVALGCGAEGDDAPPVPRDGGVNRRDSSVDSARPEAGDALVRDSGGGRPDAPPPMEDTSAVDDFGVPPPGSRIEGTLGAAGGSLEGVSGTPLAGVKLVVPAGALSSEVLFAIDLADAPTGPGGATVVSPFIRVGPEGVAFAIPARLTLPYSTTVSSPQLAAVARIGFSWSSLHDPTGDSTTVTASMRRSSAAALVRLDLSSVAPKLTAKTPSGSTLFLDGSGFGVAQVFRPGGVGGTPFVSNVTVDGVVAETLGWSEGSISIRMPATDGGTVTVTTPGGASSL